MEVAFISRADDLSSELLIFSNLAVVFDEAQRLTLFRKKFTRERVRRPFWRGSPARIFAQSRRPVVLP